ncbi:MAG: hypothetical protein AAB336_07265, partial [Acidobacteriota bacterium]
MEEKELFEEYEMRSWEFSPRIYKILGIATITNLLFLAAFGQFNLLTTRGCDTPYAGIVCQVLDSAYVASTFLGDGKEWERRPFTETEISDAEITYIDVSNKLEYPEGYFALANPEQSSENLTPTDELAGLPNSMNSNSPLTPLPSSDSSLVDKPQVTPTPNKSLEDQEDVKSPWEIAGNSPSYKAPRIKPVKTKPSKNNSIMSNESPTSLNGGPVAKVTPTPKPPQPTPVPTPTDAEAQIAKENFKINKEPFNKLAENAIAIQDDKTKKIDLKQPFTVVLNGVLTKEGKFDPTTTRFDTSKLKGDQEIQNFAKDAIQAIGDSGILGYLQTLGVDKVGITLVQDEKQISAVIRSNQNNEERARTISSGFNGIIAIAHMNTKDDPEVQALLKGLKFQPDGKSFVINFAMPKDQAHQLIDKKLQEA